MLLDKENKDYIWNPRYALGYLLVFICPKLVNNGKLQQSSKYKTTKDLDPMGVKFGSPYQLRY